MKISEDSGAGPSNLRQGFDWTITRSADQECRILTVSARYRADLFSKIAGVLTLNGFNIINANCSRDESLAFDMFKIQSINKLSQEERLRKAEQQLPSALAGRLDLSFEIEKQLRKQKTEGSHVKPEVIIANRASYSFTTIKVSGLDFPGFLFTVTDALYKCRVDIETARITTVGDRAIDEFCVRTFDGQRVDSLKQMALIRVMIEGKLK